MSSVASTPCRVLIVEDNIADAELVEILLGEAPSAYEVRHAGTLQQGLAALSAEPFDVLLLDLRLPDAAGLEVFRAAAAHLKAVPAIVFTGAAEQELGQACIDAGAQDFLSKNELTCAGLHKAVVYAIARFRDARMRQQLAERLYETQHNETIGRLVVGMAHDFGNLLGGVRLLAEGAARRLDEAHPAKPALDSIEDAAKRGHDLVRRLLQVGRGDGFEGACVSLADVVERMRSLIVAVTPGIALDWRCGGAPCFVSVDVGQFEQLLLNLVLNARDAMAEGGTLTLELSEVALENGAALAPGPYVALRVRDTGPGVAPELAGRIFEPFFTTKQRDEASGVGLAMGAAFAQEHGGALELEPNTGAGACFRLLLPRQDAPTQVAATKV